MSKIKIGILGGGFNPPTIGHIQLAELCAKYLDRVWIMPCNKHINKSNLVDNGHRLEMLKSIKFSTKNILISDFEIISRSDGKTYETINKLKEIYNNFDDLDIEFYIILGSDNVENIKSFYMYENLINENNFCLVNRCGYMSDNFKLFKNNDNNILIENANIVEISSTEIRNNIDDQDYCINNLNPEIYKYILINSLFCKTK